MAYSPESIVAISVVLPLLAVVAVGLRFLVRLRIHPSRIGPDDWLALGAVIFVIADGANLVVGATLGIQGRIYEGEIPRDRYILESKSDYAQVILEKPLYGMMKLSAIYFYRRMFFIKTGFMRFSAIMIVLLIAWTVAFMLACTFSCGIDFNRHWTPGLLTEPPYCVDRNILNLLFSVTDVIGDIVVMVMPYPCIRGMHITTRERVGLVAIFLLGALSTVASVIRLGFIAEAFTQNYSGGGNVHGSGIAPSVWSTVEASVGVLAVCLPPLGPLIRKIHVPEPISGPVKRVLFSPSRRKGSSQGSDTEWFGSRNFGPGLKFDLNEYQPESEAGASDNRSRKSSATLVV